MQLEEEPAESARVMRLVYSWDLLYDEVGRRRMGRTELLINEVGDVRPDPDVQRMFCKQSFQLDGISPRILVVPFVSVTK